MDIVTWIANHIDRAEIDEIAETQAYRYRKYKDEVAYKVLKHLHSIKKASINIESR